MNLSVKLLVAFDQCSHTFPIEWALVGTWVGAAWNFKAMKMLVLS